MKRGIKIALVSTALVTGLGAAAVAVSGPECGEGYRGDGMGMRGGFGDHHRSGWMQQDSAKFMQKRLGAIEERLELSVDQQPAWESFKEKLTARMNAMQSRREAMHAEGNDGTSVVDRLDARTAMMSEMLTGMTEFRSDLEAFYNVLTPEQQATVNEHFAKRGMRHGPF